MIRRTLLALLLLACSCGGRAGVGRGAAVASAEDLVETELAFAGSVASGGARDAFLEFSSEDAVIFRPNPINARKWCEEITEGNGLLEMEPAYVEISSSGDLGYATGPWRFLQQSGDSEPASAGHYLTIWRKDEAGRWRVALHMENVHPAASKEASAVESRVTTAVRPPLDTEAAVQSERELLIATDRLFSEEAEAKGLVAAYMSFSADDIFFCRMGAQPQVGKTRVRQALLKVTGTMTWEPIYADVSRAGDLGYTYGVARLDPEASGMPAETSSYVRVWRMDADGRWSVALDIALPSGVAQPEDEPR